MQRNKCILRVLLCCAVGLYPGIVTKAAWGQNATSNPASQPSLGTNSISAAEERDWWKNAVIYEIYPRSFQDSDSDGIGDLNGITEHLNYLNELGVDAIWLTPVYPSPQVDFGYDISDYENIDPQYGTMADFDRLIAEANQRHIHVIMDMVMNHSSDLHQWFRQSRSSRNNPYRDWYIWREGKGETSTSKGEPPNNWQSNFGGSAWQWDPQTRQYYYHKYYVQQPTLNWYNLKVQEAFKEVVRFWLKRGVSGFRFDSITELFVDSSFADEAVLLDNKGTLVLNSDGEPRLVHSKTDNQPEVHPVMQELHAVASAFDSDSFPGNRIFIGETYLPDIAELEKQYGTPERPEFELPMDTQIAFINKFDVSAFRSKLNDAETQLNGHIPLLLFDNHDNPRIDARYGDGLHNTDIQRALSTILFASRGAALFYYGDEIGMETTPPARREDVKDPIGITGWPGFKGRDGERTPMQWNATANAGFCPLGAKPWLPVPPDYITLNAKAEETNSDSLLVWNKNIIHLKKTNPAIKYGEEIMLDTGNNKVLSWMRIEPGTPAVVISVNFTAETQTVSLSIPGSEGKVKTLMKTPDGVDPERLRQVELGPYGVYIGEVKQ